jgi:lysine 2,3-aminomutase
MEANKLLDAMDVKRLRGSSCWLDWHWQMRNRIHIKGKASFPTVITPYYASLIEKRDSTDPIFRMVVEQDEESLPVRGLHPDPLAEEKNLPVPGLIRRYVDRAVILATSRCAANCRYCDRKRLAGNGGELSEQELAGIVAYLNREREIRDVIISGGDPLTLEDGQIEKIISSVRNAGSVEIVRIGTRAPVTIPMRVTEDLCSMLKKYHPLYINTHFNHPRELTEEAARACGMLADAGIPIGNQSVLLRGVNDDAEILAELYRGLLRIRVRPYYLFQCEPVSGTAHLRVPIQKGMAIMAELRNRAGGMALPSYVLDTEDLGGKIPLTPDRVTIIDGEIFLRTNDGRLIAL